VPKAPRNSTAAARSFVPKGDTNRCALTTQQTQLALPAVIANGSRIAGNHRPSFAWYHDAVMN
jgi:hypothetical protein